MSVKLVRLSEEDVAAYRARAEVLFRSPGARGVMVTKLTYEVHAVVTLDLNEPVERAAFDQLLETLERAK